jgi:hypothetical protein
MGGARIILATLNRVHTSLHKIDTLERLDTGFASHRRRLSKCRVILRNRLDIA